jgi:hypothetical protein
VIQLTVDDDGDVHGGPEHSCWSDAMKLNPFTTLKWGAAVAAVPLARATHRPFHLRAVAGMGVVAACGNDDRADRFL